MEPWISSKEICAFLGISKRTLINHTNKKYFTRGTHWRYKDPLNENSHKVWKRSAVDHILSQPTNVLRRRICRVNQIKTDQSKQVIVRSTKKALSGQ